MFGWLVFHEPGKRSSVLCICALRRVAVTLPAPLTARLQLSADPQCCLPPPPCFLSPQLCGHCGVLCVASHDQARLAGSVSPLPGWHRIQGAGRSNGTAHAGGQSGGRLPHVHYRGRCAVLKAPSRQPQLPQCVEYCCRMCSCICHSMCGCRCHMWQLYSCTAAEGIDGAVSAAL